MNKQLAVKISESIISNEIALDFNERLKHTVLYKKMLKNRLRLAQKELIKVEGMFDDLHDNENESTDFVYEIHRKMVNEICDLGFMEFENITNILKAYKKDPKSIEGIVNKINKYK